MKPRHSGSISAARTSAQAVGKDTRFREACGHATVLHKPRLLSDNGRSHLAIELADYLDIRTWSISMTRRSIPDPLGPVTLRDAANKLPCVALIRPRVALACRCENHLADVVQDQHRARALCDDRHFVPPNNFAR